LKNIVLILFSLFFCDALFAQADLTVVNSSIAVSPASQHIGMPIHVAFNIKNIGSSGSANCHVNIYISPTLTLLSAKLLGSVSLQALAPDSSSGIVQFVHAVPYGTGSGNNFIIVAPNFNHDVAESDYSNNNNSIPLNINVAPWAAQYLPYPVIFIHGLNSSNDTWNELVNDIQDTYGWSYGGNMNFCLNQDGDNTYSSALLDYHDWTNMADLRPDDFYTVNFNTDLNGNAISNGSLANAVLSNQAAIVKQGLAIRDAIAHVRMITGKDKVILVGHSMGGLASREYLQNNNLWQFSTEHNVAKLLTIGTPHGGSNSTTFISNIFGGADYRSEAIRDLRTSYFYSFDDGVYLFGGTEIEDLTHMSDLYFNDFYNVDVNCNGLLGENIVGLNNKTIPNDLDYSCIIGTGNFLLGDGIVSRNSANINNFLAVNADTFELDLGIGITHTDLPKQFQAILNGIDEPGIQSQAYSIESNKFYSGTITRQSIGTFIPKDFDYYTFNVSSNSNINLQVYNIPVADFRVNIINSTSNIVHSQLSNGKGYLNISSNIPSGNYYLEFSALHSADSWLTPYGFQFSLDPIISTPILCAGLTNLTAPSGNFSEGSGSSNYSNNANCSWLINPSGASSITLSFSNFNTELVNDKVNVYDGSSNSAALIGSFSGNVIPSNITSSGGVMFVEFISNTVLNASGWSASYTSYSSPVNTTIDIISCEYWFDNDYANKVSLAITPQQDINLNTMLASANILQGVHAFHIRFKQSNGLWSVVQSQSIVQHPEQQQNTHRKIVQFEYWLDNDYLNKIQNNITPIQTFNLASYLPLPAATEGIHSFHYRTKDDAGYYSIVNTQTIQIFPQVQPSDTISLTQYEYWFDNNYTSVQTGSINNQSNYILISSLNSSFLSMGVHSLHVRFKQSNGLYSTVITSTFIKVGDNTQPTSAITLTQYEYWFDNDYASAQTMSISNQSNFILQSSLNSSSLTMGIHSLHIRFKQSNNLYSSVITSTFIKLGNNLITPNKIDTYRYWFDSNTAATVTVPVSPPVTNLNLTANINTSSLTNGTHQIHIQFKDVGDLWSVVLTDTIVKTLSPIANFTAIDTSVCIGNPIQFNNLSQNSTSYVWNFGDGSATSTLTNPTHIYASAGNYTVTLLATGNSQTDTIIKFAYISVSTSLIPLISFVGNDTVCQGQSINLATNYNGVGYTYIWKNNNLNISGATANTYDATTNGNYSVLVTNSNGCSGTSSQQSLVFLTMQTPTVSISTTASNICEGDSVTFISSVSNSGSSPAYQWYLNNLNTGITATQFTLNNPLTNDSIYLLVQSNGICNSVNAITSNTIGINVNSNPTPIIVGVTEICPNQSITLSTLNSYSSYIWGGGETTPSITINNGGNYSLVVRDNHNCQGDTSIFINSVNINTGITQSFDSLIANSTTGLYQWVDCSNNTIISNQNNQIFIPTANGSYAVIITQNSCVDTSVCYSLTLTNLQDKPSNEILIYPNPTKDKITVANAVGMNVEVFNALGQLIFIKQNASSLEIISLEGASKGLYNVRVAKNEKIFNIKMIKN
jgi:pimeloyl-ACP methyl ester carboxylesterase/PKD repeat protein